MLQVLVDLVILLGAFLLAYALRFDFEIPGSQLERALLQLPGVVALQFAVLLGLRVYSFVWRYVGMRELFVFLRAAAFVAIPLLGARLLLPYGSWSIPLSVILLAICLGFGGLVSARVLRRAIYEQFEASTPLPGSPITKAPDRRPVLLLGAGRAGVLAAKELLGRANGLAILGFVDDDPDKQGSVIHGIRVIGATRDLPRLVEELQIDHVILTIARASRGDLRRMVQLCERIPVRVRIIPGYYEILEGQVEVSRIRDVQIEDLLGRDPVELEEAALEDFLADRVVMVTGAGGSIGSELCRQVARMRPRRLLLVERAEPALFRIDLELRDAHPDVDIVAVMADVGDMTRMQAVFQRERPAVVVHAAAHKHVPLMEINSGEALKNNVLATHGLTELAGRFAADVFVQVSTDKAVRPTSIMGATKRLAEIVVQGQNSRHVTRYVAVRFGNVLGSAGSVIPIFREQILHGGPVTVTHPDMVRYFMTIPEASQLVLQAGAMGRGGEIFVLDMGEPVRIVDLARDMIRLSGLKPDEDIEIVFTGTRPGEKLFEELESDGEHLEKTRHPKIFIGEMVNRIERLDEILGRVAKAADSGNDAEVRALLSKTVPESHLEHLERPSERPPAPTPSEAPAPVASAGRTSAIPRERTA